MYAITARRAALLALVLAMFAAVTSTSILSANESTPSLSFVSTQPERVLDSRTGINTAAVRLEPNESRFITKTQLGLPVDAVAVTLNVTVTQPATAGFVAVYPDDGIFTVPTVSTVNFQTGWDIANSTTINFGINEQVEIFSNAPTHVVLDLTGYWSAMVMDVAAPPDTTPEQTAIPTATPDLPPPTPTAPVPTPVPPTPVPTPETVTINFGDPDAGIRGEWMVQSCSTTNGEFTVLLVEWIAADGLVQSFNDCEVGSIVTIPDGAVTTVSPGRCGPCGPETGTYGGTWTLVRL